VLEDAQKALDAMNAACSAMEAGQWGEAERSLHQVQETVGRLLREVGDKSREVILAPTPDKGDRG
jgi:hypothetical protein